MSSFISSLGYSTGQFIKFRARASNEAGPGQYSIPNLDSVVAQSVPV